MAPTISQTDQGPSGEPEVPIRPPEFSELSPQTAPVSEVPFNRFYDVSVTVWAELGRVTMPLGELLKLGEGSTIKLNRAISAPVDLVAQGTCFARGEVVVVDEYFGIRIKEILDPSQRLGSVTG